MEEDTNSVTSELFAILQEKTLVNALLCVLRLAGTLCSETSYEESVGGTFDNDIWMRLNETEGVFIGAER